jgi:hypothetical protein
MSSTGTHAKIVDLVKALCQDSLEPPADDMLCSCTESGQTHHIPLPSSQCGRHGE